MPSPRTWTVFMLLRTTRDWLAKAPEERFAYIRETIRPIIDAHPTVKMRFFDTDAYSSRITDIVVWQTPDLAAYQTLVKELRDTEFWAHYFEVIDIIPAVEDAYATHYGIAPLTAD